MTIFDILDKCSDAYYNIGNYYILSDDDICLIRDDLGIICDNTEVSDRLYDTLYDGARKKYPSNPYFLSVGSKVRGDKVKLPVPTGSMVECKKGEMNKWLVPHTYVVISSKLDGNSLLLAYSNGKLKIAYTRGDGISGQDCTRNVINLPSIPKILENGFTGYIRGECIAQKNQIPDFLNALKDETGKTYSNGRNAIAGMLNSKTSPKAFDRFGMLVAYQIVDYRGTQVNMFQDLIEMGFRTPNYTWMNTDLLLNNDESTLINMCTKAKAEDMYECDGIIVSQNEVLDGYSGFETGTLNPKCSRKYKVSTVDYSKISTLLNIKWQISRWGLLKPVGVIEPVGLEGAIVSNVTLYNLDFILKNNIKIGCKGRIIRSGSVIPKWIETIK